MPTTDLIIAIQLPVWSVLLGPYGSLCIPALEGPGLNVSQLIALNSQRTASSRLEFNRWCALPPLNLCGLTFYWQFLIRPKVIRIKAPTQSGLKIYDYLLFSGWFLSPHLICWIENSSTFSHLHLMAFFKKKYLNGWFLKLFSVPEVGEQKWG